MPRALPPSVPAGTFEPTNILGGMQEFRAWDSELFYRSGPILLNRPSGSRFTAGMVGRDVDSSTVVKSYDSQKMAGNKFIGEVGSFFSDYFSIKDACRKRFVQAAEEMGKKVKPTENSGACLAIATWDELRMVDPCWPDEAPRVTFLLRDGFSWAWQEVANG